MARFSDKTYEDIGYKLALGFSQDDAVALVTGRDKKAVNKYAWQVCKNDKVQVALAKYKAEFEKNALCEKEQLEWEAMRYIFGDLKDEVKPADKLKFMHFVKEINGFAAKDQVGKMNAETKRGNAVLNMTNKINGNER